MNWSRAHSYHCSTQACLIYIYLISVSVNTTERGPRVFLCTLSTLVEHQLSWLLPASTFFTQSSSANLGTDTFLYSGRGGLASSLHELGGCFAPLLEELLLMVELLVPVEEKTGAFGE